jgi:hypothetical protein
MDKEDVQEAVRLMLLYHGFQAAAAAVARAQEVLLLGHMSDFSDWMRIAKIAGRRTAKGLSKNLPMQ